MKINCFKKGKIRLCRNDCILNAESVSVIDVSNLTSGTYFVKVDTNKGTSNAKFIKN